MTKSNSKSNTVKKAAAVSSVIKSSIHVKHEKKLKCDREKTRRDNINENFGKLMSLLLMLDPEIGGDTISGDLFAEKIVPPKDLLPRANLLERACVTIRRLHLEKEHWKARATENYNDISAKMQGTSAIQEAPFVALDAAKSRQNITLENSTQVSSETLLPHSSSMPNSMLSLKSPVSTKSVTSNDQQQGLIRVKRGQVKVQQQLQKLQKQFQQQKLQKQLQKQQKKCKQQQPKQQLRQQLHHPRQLLQNQPKQHLQQQPKQQQEQQLQQLLKHHLQTQQLRQQKQHEQAKQRLLQHQSQHQYLPGENHQEQYLQQPLHYHEQKQLEQQLQKKLQQELQKQIHRKKQEEQERHQHLQQHGGDLHHNDNQHDNQQQLILTSLQLMSQLQQGAKSQQYQ